MPLSSSQVVGLIELDKPAEHLLSFCLRHHAAAREEVEFVSADIEELNHQLRGELQRVLERLQRALA